MGKLVDVDKDQAEAYRALAEAGLFEAQRQEARAKARAAKVTARKAEREEADLRASNDRNYVLHYEAPVRDTQKVREQLDRWHRLNDSAPWTIIMNSPGGSVIEGMALFDHIAAHSIRGGGTHEITIKVRGWAASMGGVLLQSADHRVVGPEALILIHKVSTMTGGSLDEIEDEVKFLKLINDRADKIFVARSNGKLTLARLRKEQLRKDWWLDSGEALKLGIVDRIG